MDEKFIDATVLHKPTFTKRLRAVKKLRAFDLKEVKSCVSNVSSDKVWWQDGLRKIVYCDSISWSIITVSTWLQKVICARHAPHKNSSKY